MSLSFSPRRVRRQALILLLVFVVALVILALQLTAPIGELMPEALAALEPGSGVQVSRSPWLVFAPEQQGISVGLIFYPGGRVAPEAYSPLARALAEAGYLAVITPMPLNLAVLNWTAADGVIEAYPQVETWVMAGHSLGGAMAARYAQANPDTIDGLVLLAAYPEAELSLRGLNLAVTTIYGDRDGLATLDEIEGSFAQLPADARKVLIAGGNHAQFGWYGSQANDLSAQISRDEQQRQVIEAMLWLLREAGK